jgi:hypothetical protein
MARDMARTIAVVVPLCGLLCVSLAAQPTPRSIPSGEASISGRVINQHTRRPVESAVVTLSSPTGEALVTESDREGRYQFERIGAGEYRLSAQHRDYGQELFGQITFQTTALAQVRLASAEKRTGIDFELRQSGSISGRITNERGEPLGKAFVSARTVPIAGTSWPLGSRLLRTNDRGEYTIHGLLEGSYHVSVRCCDIGRNQGVASDPIYYPGTPNLAEARAVRVAPTETTKGIDILVPSSELLRIQGQFVRNGTGGRLEAFLLAGSTRVHSVSVNTDGSFSTPRVRAGRYTLVGRTRESDDPEATWLTVDLSSEMTDVILGLSATGSIAGRIVADDGSAVSDTLQLAAVLADDGKELDALRRDRVDVRMDGTFELAGLVGERILNVIGLVNDWKVDRVLIGKTPTTTFLVHPGQRIDDITIVLTRR